MKKKNDKKAQMMFVCPVQWDQMDAVEGGRFCQACQLKVFDLTDCSRQEIQRITAENGGEICGRVNTSEIDIPLEQRILAMIGRPLKAAEIFGLSLLLTTSVAYGQGKRNKKQNLEKMTNLLVELQNSCNWNGRGLPPRLGGSIVYHWDSIPIGGFPVTEIPIDSSKYFRLRRTKKSEKTDFRVVSDPVIFRKNDSELDPAGHELLKFAADTIRKYPNALVKIYGYIDEVNGETNENELSKKRAEKVFRRLREYGIQNKVKITGQGQPYSAGEEENDWPARRVEIVLVE